MQVIRTFNALGVRDKRVVRALREREKGGGPLGRYIPSFDYIVKMVAV